jgi:hypothetical protein
MYQKALFILAVMCLFSLGMYGQYQLSPDRLTTGLTTSVYQILMLFLLAGEWTLELQEIPLAIELVRFTAPLVSIASIVLVIAANARDGLANYFLRFYRGHTIVVGLGEKSYQFLQTCEKKSHFVVVERNSDNGFIARTRAMGVKVVTRDIVEDSLFDHLALTHAESIIIFTNSDTENVEVALKLRQHLRHLDPGKLGLRVHIHLDDFSLAHQLENYPRFSADQSTTEVSFFSVYDLSARLLLRDYPAEIFADVAGHPRIHLAIYGFGRLAEKIVTESSLLFHFRNQSKLKLTIFDEQIDEKRQAFEAHFPHLSSICDIDFVQHIPLYPSDFPSKAEAQLATVTQHIICHETDEVNLAHALGLRQILLSKKASNSAIFVRMQRSSGLAQLVHTDKGQPEIPDGIYPFGMLDSVLHADNILSPQLDEIARATHEMYANEAASKNADGPTPPSWAQLTQAERKQNRLKADHWSVRLRSSRCEISEQTVPVLEFAEGETELQALMEHNRYVDQKISDGWRYGEDRSIAAKTNPFLLPWDELPEEQRARELRDVSAQPAYFARKMARFVKRRLVIGVTGHRLNKMDVNNKKLRDQISKVLVEIGKDHPAHQFTLLSPLAEGADRLVTALAMEILGARLQVLLPLPYELYISDFTSGESIEEFQRMVGLAQSCFEMPMKFGTISELADASPLNLSRNKQYALAGAYIVQRCDYLFAIYDGQPAAGIGGTGQVLNWYQEGIVDDDFLYPDVYFEPPHRRPALVFHPYPP